MKSVIESKKEFEALDPILQAEYTEANGLFVLNADGIREHPDVKNLASALKAVKDKKTESAKRLEELEAAKKVADEATLAEQNKFKELSELKTTEAQKYADDLKALQDKISLGEIVAESQVMAAELNPKDTTSQYLLKGQIKKYLANGENGISFLNKDGTPSDRKSIIEKMTADFPKLIAGNPASGGDAPGNTGHSDQTTKSTVDILYPTKG